MEQPTNQTNSVVGGVDTHKDLHIAAVVDEQDHVLGTHCFPATRLGYRQMLQWMQSFGVLRRVGVESTGTYGAGLLRHLQAAGAEVLEVTTPDKHDRRRRGKDDDLDAPECAACGIRTSVGRDAEDVRWDDRVAAGAQGLSQDGSCRPQNRLTGDPKQHRLRP